MLQYGTKLPGVTPRSEANTRTPTPGASVFPPTVCTLDTANDPPAPKH